jgi:hypothetical protein
MPNCPGWTRRPRAIFADARRRDAGKPAPALDFGDVGGSGSNFAAEPTGPIYARRGWVIGSQ